MKPYFPPMTSDANSCNQGLGHYTRRKGWLAGRPREPCELLGCQQRRHQLVHRFMGFSGKLAKLQLFFSKLDVTNLLRSSRFGLIKLPATVIQMDFSFASADSSLIRDFSSPSAFKRLYYPPISDTRLRISGLRILAYAGRSDETCPTYTINSFYLFIFGRCMSPSWRHLNPDSFGDSRKRKPADLIPFVSPFPSLVIIFLFFLYLFFSPASDPKNSLHNSFCVF